MKAAKLDETITWWALEAISAFDAALAVGIAMPALEATAAKDEACALRTAEITLESDERMEATLASALDNCEAIELPEYIDAATEDADFSTLAYEEAREDIEALAWLSADMIDEATAEAMEADMLAIEALAETLAPATPPAIAEDPAAEERALTAEVAPAAPAAVDAAPAAPSRAPTKALAVMLAPESVEAVNPFRPTPASAQS